MARRTGERNRYESSRSYYMTSNVAYEIAPAYIPEVPQKGAERVIVKEAEKEAQKEQRRLRIARFVHRIKLLCAVAFVFAGGILVMLASANVTAERVSISKLRTELLTLKSENNSLKSEISQKMDLNYIGSEAEERLSMSTPQNYQVLYINVPKQSYTVKYDTAAPAEEAKTGNVLSKVAALFKKD